MKNSKYIFYAVCFCLMLTSCDGVFTQYLFDAVNTDKAVDDVIVPSEKSDEESGGLAPDLEETPTVGSSTTAGNPNLTTLIAYAPDSEDYIPVTGSVSEFASGDMVAVSAVSGSVSMNECEERAYVRTSVRAYVEEMFANVNTHARQHVNTWFVPSAHASETACEDGETVKYCPIRDDGMFECFGKFADASVASLNVTVVDSECNNKSGTATVSILGGLHYLGNTASDVTVADGAVYALADPDGDETTANSAIKLAEGADSRLATQGDHSSAVAYEERAANGSSFAFDGTDQNCFAVLNSTGGINTSSLADKSTCGTRVITGAKAYTKIKNTLQGDVYFGIDVDDPRTEAVETTTEASIYYYHESDEKLDMEDRTYEDMFFIASGDRYMVEVAPDHYVPTVPMRHKQTVDFDINSLGQALVLFIDEAGNYRLRGTTAGGTMRFGGEEASLGNTTDHEFSDVNFIDDTTAMLLDTKNDELLFKHFDVAKHRIRGITSTVAEDLAGCVDKASAVLNEERSRLYLMCRSTNEI
ncbi:MAG TPA: hypothetical protein VJC18_07920, partial [bacterium]|nr:hypothetical protein [bacterium]